MKKFYKILLTLVIIFNFTLLVSCKKKENPKKEQTYYNIKWYSENNELLKEEKVLKGILPSYSYEVVDTKEWDYTFKGWATNTSGSVLSSIPAATADASYFAVVSKEKRKYNLTLKQDEKEDVETYEYNSVINEIKTPVRPGYKFLGWFTDEALTKRVSFPITITSDLTLYSAWNEKVDIAKYLENLLENVAVTPYSFIPETLKVDYSKNLVKEEDIVLDYSDFVETSKLLDVGFGDQWNMIVENLQQSMRFYSVLSVIETISTSATVAFNNYLDKNPENTANYNFQDGIYNIFINFDGQIISFVVEFNKNIPLIGDTTVQIAMHMDINSPTRYVRVQLNDANALKYEVSENHYKFAIRYLGIRRAMFEIKRTTETKVEGHINEFLEISGISQNSSADFYIDENYASVVGNKASGMVGITGYINELYDVKTGHLLGYDVRETLSEITYNTLWLPLNQISGLTSIKYQPSTEDEAGKFFVNNAVTEWKNLKVGGIGTKMFSRRFDIEFRNVYYYLYDEVEKEYIKLETKIPMLFVQNEFIDSLSKDVKNANSNVELEILLSKNHLNKILSDYNTLIDVFTLNKEKVTIDAILEYIGSKAIFE